MLCMLPVKHIGRAAAAQFTGAAGDGWEKSADW
jgi:hypothetical protein